MRYLLMTCIAMFTAIFADSPERKYFKYNEVECTALTALKGKSISEIGDLANKADEYALFILGLENYYPKDKAKPNYKSAYYCFCKSASLGCGAALYFLSDMYAWGNFVKENDYMSAVYLIMANRFQHPEYKTSTELIYHYGRKKVINKIDELIDIKTLIISNNIKNREKASSKEIFFYQIEDITHGDDAVEWEGK